MPSFRYSAYTAKGEMEEGIIEAGSQSSLLQALHNRGLVPIEVSLAKGTGKPKRSFDMLTPAPTLSLAGWSEVTREFGVYLEAGLPVDECLRLISTDGRTAAIRNLSADLLDASLSGSSLSEAIEKHSHATPPLIVPLIKAGEKSGNIAPAMNDLSEFLSSQIGIRKELRSALTYPAVLVVTAIATFLVIALTLVPALLPMFDQANVEPPTILSVIHAFSEFVGGHLTTIAIVLLLISALMFIWFRTENGKLQMSKLLLKIPFFGPLVRNSQISLFAKTLGTLLTNGVTLSVGLETAKTVVGNQAMIAGLRGTQKQIMEGSSLTDTLTRSGVFSPLSLRFVSVGEETSQLGPMLLNLSKILQKNTEQKIKTGLALLGPALTIIIGLAVGGLIITVMQAVLSVNELVLR